MGTKSKWKGDTLRFYNDAVVDESVVTTTANGAITNYGLSLLSYPNVGSGATVGVYVMDAPMKGVTKQIVNYSTNHVFVRFSTVNNSVILAAPGSPLGSTINSLILMGGSTYPIAVSLRGVSTTLWAITGAANGWCAGTTIRTTAGNGIMLSSGSLATSS